MENTPNTNNSTISNTKRIGVVSLMVFALLALLGGVYYFGFNNIQNDDVPPALVGDPSALQGFIGEDVGLTIDHIYKKYEFLGFTAEDKRLFDKAKAEFADENVPGLKLKTTAQNQGLHYVYSNTDTTFEKVLRALDPSAEAVAVATYDTNKGKFVITPNTYYVGTEEIDIDDFDDYSIPRGQVIYVISFRDTTLYGFQNGTELAEVQFNICNQTKNGWYNFALEEDSEDNIASVLEGCKGKIEQVWSQDSMNPVEFERVYRNNSAGVDSWSKLENHESDLSLYWVKIGTAADSDDDDDDNNDDNEIGQVQNLSASSSDDGTDAIVRWTRPASTDSDDISSYVVDIKLGNTSLANGPLRVEVANERVVLHAHPEQTATKATVDISSDGENVIFTLNDAGLLPTTQYNVSVYAVAKDGETGDSASTTFNTPGQTAVPSDTKLTIGPNIAQSDATVYQDEKRAIYLEHEFTSTKELKLEQITVSKRILNGNGQEFGRVYLIVDGVKKAENVFTDAQVVLKPATPITISGTTNIRIEADIKPTAVIGNKSWFEVMTASDLVFDQEVEITENPFPLASEVKTVIEEGSDTIAGVPSQLRSFRFVEYNPATRMLVLAWDRPATTEQVTSYELRYTGASPGQQNLELSYKEDPDSGTPRHGAPPSASYFTEGVEGTINAYISYMPFAGEYSFSIAAINSFGTGATATLDDVQIPASQPQNLTASDSNNTIELNWDAPAELESITNYQVFYTVDGVQQSTINLDSQDYTYDEGAQTITASISRANGQEHSVYIVAQSAGGNSLPSSTATVEGETAPAAVTGLGFTVLNQEDVDGFNFPDGTLEWDNPSGSITSYLVEYGTASGGVNRVLSQQTTGSTGPFISLGNAINGHVEGDVFNLDITDVLYFKVAVKNAAGQSQYTNIFSSDFNYE